MEHTTKWIRIFLGLFLIGYAVNQFVHILPTSYGQMPEIGRNFIDSVAIYLPFLYIFEIIIGAFLVLNMWTSFILIVLFPLSVSFMIFNITNQDLGAIWPALIVGLLNVILVFDRRDKYMPLFD